MNTELPTKHLAVPADVLMREVSGEAVLLNVTSESYFGLDEVGTRMWLALTESGSFQSARARLLEEFDVEPGRLEADLRELLGRLLALGLLEESDA